MVILEADKEMEIPIPWSSGLWMKTYSKDNEILLEHMVFPNEKMGALEEIADAAMKKAAITNTVLELKPSGDVFDVDADTKIHIKQKMFETYVKNITFVEVNRKREMR